MVKGAYDILINGTALGVFATDIITVNITGNYDAP